MIKIRCQYCDTWCGNMDLKISKGTEWEMIATCPDCIEREKQQPFDPAVEQLKKIFGIFD